MPDLPRGAGTMADAAELSLYPTSADELAKGRNERANESGNRQCGTQGVMYVGGGTRDAHKQCERAERRVEWRVADGSGVRASGGDGDESSAYSSRRW